MTSVAGLRELLERATPGPWGTDGSPEAREWGIRAISGDQPVLFVGVHPEWPPDSPDGLLVVAAVNSLPALLDVASAADEYTTHVAAAAGTEDEDAAWFSLLAALARLREGETK